MQYGIKYMLGMRRLTSVIALSSILFLGITSFAQVSPYSPQENEVIKRRTCEFWTHGLNFAWPAIPGSSYYSLHLWDVLEEQEIVLADRIAGLSFHYASSEGCNPWGNECCRFYDQAPSGMTPEDKTTGLGDKQFFWWVENDRGQFSKFTFFALERDTEGQNPAELAYKLNNIECDSAEQNYAVVMPNQHFGDVEWGYMTIETSPNYIRKDNATPPHCRNYQISNLPTYDGDPMLSQWIVFGGKTTPSDMSYLDVNLLFDYRNQDVPNEGMTQAFQDSFDFRMPRSDELMKWPEFFDEIFCGPGSDSERIDVRSLIDDRLIRDLQTAINSGMSIGDAIIEAFTTAPLLTRPGEFTYNFDWPAEGYYKDGIACDSFSGHEWLSNQYVRETGQINCISYSRFCCAVLRAVGIPARTKSTITQHNDISIWIPNRELAPQNDVYSYDDGQWVFFVPGDVGSPHPTKQDGNPLIRGIPYPRYGTHIVRTISYASDKEEYFNVEWTPRGLQNLAFKASSDGLVGPKALKLIDVVPGPAALRDTEFYARVTAAHPKQPAFLAHHLIPFGPDHFMYIYAIEPGVRYKTQVFKLVKNTQSYPFDIRMTTLIGGDVTLDFSHTDHLQDVRIPVGTSYAQFHVQKLTLGDGLYQLILEIESM